ncbi:hypothetical protein VTO42DRAFT_8261 [Malbranchea cinnamomea]
MDGNRSFENDTLFPTAPPPSYESVSQTPAPSQPLEAPPDYQTAVEQTVSASSVGETNLLSQTSSAGQSGHPVLTIDGRYIVSSTCSQEPIYSLTHALDGHETNTAGVLLTRIEQQRTATRDGTTRKAKKRDVFALRNKSTLSFSGYEIDGKRFLSGKTGFMSTRASRSGMGWAAGGKGLPSFTLRPSKMLSRSGERQYEWRDNKTDKVIAIEIRRTWDTKDKVELTPPKLQLRFELGDVDKEYLDFLIAAWCMHNWREAKDLTKEPLTWEEFKEQAKTTMKNKPRYNWYLV